MSLETFCPSPPSPLCRHCGLGRVVEPELAIIGESETAEGNAESQEEKNWNIKPYTIFFLGLSHGRKANDYFIFTFRISQWTPFPYLPRSIFFRWFPTFPWGKSLWVDGWETFVFPNVWVFQPGEFLKWILEVGRRERGRGSSGLELATRLVSPGTCGWKTSPT